MASTHLVKNVDIKVFSVVRTRIKQSISTSTLDAFSKQCCVLLDFMFGNCEGNYCSLGKIWHEKIFVGCHV